MATTDWREVYRQERRRPAYVIENGRGIVKLPVVRTWWKPKHRAQLIQEDQGRMSPRAPKRPCSHPGCGVLTDSGKCERHRIQERRELESRRPNAVAKGYGYRWRIASRAYLARNPLCVECLKRRKLVPATVTDHIVPHKGEPGLFWNEANLQSLCKRCAMTGRRP